MPITITISDVDADKLIHDVMQSFPEASHGSPLLCVGWKYEACLFVFLDREEGKRHALTRKRLRKGLEVLLRAVLAGKLKGLNLHSAFLDSTEWDASCADALVQCAIFGEVIYG